jgi:predicted Fe-Mo cluster-binding NifX family protein
VRIAIAADGGSVSAHFGRCSEYVIVDIEGDRITGRTVVPNPGHQPGFLPNFLADQGIDFIIAGGMGPKAKTLFESRGIKTAAGVAGSVDEVVDAFLRQELPAYSNVNLCDHTPSEAH